MALNPAQSRILAGARWLTWTLLASPLGCRFGRKPILTCCYLLLAASGSGAAFSPTLPIYMVFRFLCGFSISGIILSTVILSEPQGGREQGSGSSSQKSKQGDPGLAQGEGSLWVSAWPSEAP